MITATRVVATIGLALAIAPAAHATSFSSWSPATSAEQLPGTSSELNASSLDGCPIQSPNGLRLYLASSCPRFSGEPTNSTTSADGASRLLRPGKQ
jgi:hypothetical protein